METTILIDHAGEVIAPVESEVPPQVGDRAMVGEDRYRLAAVGQGEHWWYATCEREEGS